MNQTEFEQRLISLITKPQILAELEKQGILEDCFVMHPEVYHFITDYAIKYQNIPGPQIIKAKFPGFEFKSDADVSELKFLSDELVKSNVQRRAIQIINQNADLISTDPYNAIDTIVSRLQSIRRQTKVSKSLTDKEALKRLELIMKNRESIRKGMTVGIKTGINIFDNKYYGWQPGNYISIVGRLGIGKSWLLEYFSCVAYHDGKRVLYISPEMSINEVEQRWDTLMGTMYGYRFQNDKLQLGEINLEEYKQWLTKAQERSDWITYDSNSGKSFTVPGIAQMVNEFSPDLVAIDGVALLEGPGDALWSKVREISKGIKSLAQNTKVVAMVTAQANREAGVGMPATSQISYSDSIAQDSDVVIPMSSEADRPDIRYITLPKKRTGKAINKKISINFDVNNGILGIIQE
jgi:replicative DNA helicase